MQRLQYSREYFWTRILNNDKNSIIIGNKFNASINKIKTFIDQAASILLS